MDKTEALKPCPFCGAADAGHCELLDTNGGECPWEMMREDELQVSGVDANAVSFPQPRRKDGEEPCGECHLQVGETCDICGAKRAEQALAPLIAEQCAGIAENPNRAGREWVPGSLWDSIARETAAAIRAAFPKPAEHAPKEPRHE